MRNWIESTLSDSVACAILAFAAGGVTACGAAGEAPTINVGDVKQDVQAAFLGDFTSTGNDDVNVLLNSSDETANMVAPVTSGGGGGNCGVTFLSKHYAITAAHCVDATEDSSSFQYYPAGSGVPIQTIVTTGLNALYVLAASAVTGTSSESTWTNPNPIPSGVGYSVTTQTCWVKYRCDSAYGARTCPPITGDVDVALMYCPSRTSSDYLHVHSTNPVAGNNVVVEWYHEVENLMTNANDTTHTTPAQNWVGYGQNNAPKTTNYHYGHENQNQFLPLQSSRWTTGALYKILVVGDPLVSTDVPLCHGASGSAWILSGTSDVIGTTDTGEGIAAHDLCQDMAAGVPGHDNSSYVATQYARALEQSSTVLGDR